MPGPDRASPVALGYKGFVHTVIVDMVGAALSAEVEVEFPPTGLVWRMTTGG